MPVGERCGQLVSLRERAERGIAWSTCENGGRQALSFVTYAALARLLGPETFGLVALASVYLALVQIFVKQGFWTAIVQRDVLDQEHLDAAFWINLGLSTAMCVLTVVLAPLIARLFRAPELSGVLGWLSLLFVIFALSSVPSALLTRDLAFRTLAVRTVLATALGGVVGVAMAFAGWGVWSLVGQQLASAVGGTLSLWLATGWRPRLRFSNKHARDLYGFSVGVLGNEVLWFLSQRSDQTVVGYEFGAIGLGPYSLASKIVQLIVESLSGPFEAVALPALSRLQSEPHKMKGAFYGFVEVGALVSVPALTGLFILAPQLVLLAFGSQWTSAVPIVRILAVYAEVRIAFTFFHPLILAQGKPGMYFVLSTILTGSTVFGCLAGMRWSPLAVAYAITLVITIFCVVVWLFVTPSILQVSASRFCRCFLIPVFSSAVMVAVVMFVRVLFNGYQAYQSTVMCVLAGAGTYVVVALILKPALVVDLAHFIPARARVGLIEANSELIE